MAYYDDVAAYSMGPATSAAARAKVIAATMGHLAANSLKSSKAARARDQEDFFSNRLRAAQLPSVDACQSNIFTWLRVMETEAAATRMPKAEVKSRPWMFGLKHRISHMLSSMSVH